MPVVAKALACSAFPAGVGVTLVLAQCTGVVERELRRREHNLQSIVSGTGKV